MFQVGSLLWRSDSLDTSTGIPAVPSKPMRSSVIGFHCSAARVIRPTRSHRRDTLRACVLLHPYPMHVGSCLDSCLVLFLLKLLPSRDWLSFVTCWAVDNSFIAWQVKSLVEVIVVDAGCKDSTMEVVASLKTDVPIRCSPVLPACTDLWAASALLLRDGRRLRTRNVVPCRHHGMLPSPSTPALCLALDFPPARV